MSRASLPRLPTAATLAGLAALAALVASCGGKPATKAPSASAFEVRPLGTSPDPLLAPLPPPPDVARSHLLGTIARRAIGPFLGRSTHGGLAAWITQAERGGGQELTLVPLGQDGAPFGEPRMAAGVPQEATSLVVRPSGTARPGWLVAWSALLDRGEALSVLGVGTDGSSQKAAFDVERTTDHVKWVDIVPLPQGGMCVWAEETPAGDANILAAPVDGDGRPRRLPVRVARGMSGWAVTRDGDGVALALVQASNAPLPGMAPPEPDARSTRARARAAAAAEAQAALDHPGGALAGALVWLRLDGDAHPRGNPIPIGTRPTVSGDVDLVPTTPAGGTWLLGWTDRTGEDAQVTLATIDSAGKVTGPRHAMDAVGGATLVGLASGPAGIALAWTEPRGRARAVHPVHLAGVTLDGPAAQPVTSVDVTSAAAPELVATDGGFALLSTGRVCLTQDGPGCAGDAAPTFLRFDGRLVPTQTEPLFVGDRRHPTYWALAWNLACLDDRCVALAADAAAPTGIYALDLGARKSPFLPPTTAPLPPEAPRVGGVVTLASGLPYADLATTRLGDSTLVASLTTAVEVVDDRPRGGRARAAAAAAATVSVRPFDGDGRPAGPAVAITSRALPVGGVALAPGARVDDGAALAWVARDEGDAQVHVAHLDRRGHRTNEVQLTTSKGDASDVALAWAGDGWLVAWVDSRDGNGEVYATKVDRDLQRTAREERITRAPGDAGDVALVVRGDTAWVAWSDPRESPREGLSDIYAAALRASDAKRVGDETRVLSTAAHSRSPALALAGGSGGAIVAWIEDAPQGLDAHGMAVVAQLDASAHVVGIPAPLPLADAGNAAALALASDVASGGVRAFVARSHRDELTIDAVALRADATPVPPAWRLLDLDAPATFDVALSASPEALFFDDIGLTATDHRIRRAALAWRR